MSMVQLVNYSDLSSNILTMTWLVQTSAFSCGWLDNWSRRASLKQLSSLPQDLDLPGGRLVFVLMAVTGFQEREETHKTSIRISPIPAIKQSREGWKMDLEKDKDKITIVMPMCSSKFSQNLKMALKDTFHGRPSYRFIDKLFQNVLFNQS